MTGDRTVGTDDPTQAPIDSTDPSPPRADAPDRHRPSWRAGLLERYGLLVLLVLIAAAFTFLPATAGLFPTRRNIDHLLGDQTVVTVAAFAVMVPLIAGHFDVSVGSVIGLACIGTATTMSRFHLPLVAAVVVGIGVGLLIGVVNGMLVAFAKLNAITVTLAGTIIISGVVEWYTEGVSINTGISPALTGFGSGKWLSIPRPALLLVAASLIVWYVLDHTPFGRHLHMAGHNPRATHLIGVAVGRTTFYSFVVGGALAGLAGVVLCARSGGANPQDGPSLLFPALVAAFLGTSGIKPGQFNVGGTVLGVFFVAVTLSGLGLSGAQPWVQPVFNGVALLAAVGLAAVMTSRRSSG